MGNIQKHYYHQHFFTEKNIYHRTSQVVVFYSSFLYFHSHRSTKEKSGKDNTVVEMKSDNTEEAVLLGVNGEKQPPSD